MGIELAFLLFRSAMSEEEKLQLQFAYAVSVLAMCMCLVGKTLLGELCREGEEEKIGEVYKVKPGENVPLFARRQLFTFTCIHGSEEHITAVQYYSEKFVRREEKKKWEGGERELGSNCDDEGCISRFTLHHALCQALHGYVQFSYSAALIL